MLTTRNLTHAVVVFLLCLSGLFSPLTAQNKLKSVRSNKQRSKPMRCVQVGKQKTRGGSSLFEPHDPLSRKRQVLIVTQPPKEQGEPVASTEAPPLLTGKSDSVRLSRPAPLPAPPVMKPLYFVFDQDVLTEEDMNTLRAASSYLQYGYDILLEGHTDNRGSQSYNEALSLKRVERIREIMVRELGVPAQRIRLKGLGEKQPATDNNSEASRQLNRRVEVKIIPGS